MKHRIQQWIDNAFRSVAGLPDEVFPDAETAQNAIDELRQHPEYTMARFRVVKETLIPLEIRTAGQWIPGGSPEAFADFFRAPVVRLR